MRLPRMTTRRWMLVIALFALSLWLGLAAYRVGTDPRGKWIYHLWERHGSIEPGSIFNTQHSVPIWASARNGFRPLLRLWCWIGPPQHRQRRGGRSAPCPAPCSRPITQPDLARDAGGASGPSSATALPLRQWLSSTES